MDFLKQIDIMAIIRLVIIFYGVWVTRSATIMNATKTPGSWLCSDYELKHCKDKGGFANAMYQKTLWLGISSIIFGVLSLLNQFLIHWKVIDIILVILFFVMCVWFFLGLSKAKSTYISVVLK